MGKSRHRILLKTRYTDLYKALWKNVQLFIILQVHSLDTSNCYNKYFKNVDN